MEIQKLIEDPKIKIWMSEYKNKPNTQRIYLQAMRAYTDFTKKSPKELIEEAKADIRAGKFMDERAIFEDVTLFNGFLIDCGLAPKTRSSHLTGIKSFFKKYYIEFPQVRTESKVRPLEKNKKIPNKEEIQAVLNVCSPLEKALILTGCTSGLSAEEIRNLTLEDYFSGYSEEDEIATLQLRRTKTETDFITFLSPEATRAINTYLEYRERTLKGTDKLKERGLKKQRIRYSEKGEATGYLFIRDHVPNEYINTQNEELRQITHNSYMKMFQTISLKANKNTAYGDWNLIRSHNLRKYFYSSLLNAGADIFTVDYLAGHVIPESQAAYFVADPESLKKTYRKYIPYLTVQKELNVSESPEFQKLKVENEVLAREAVRATVERSEIQKLREELEEIKGLTDESTELLQLLKRNPEAVELMKKIKR